ncbi:MAG: peptide chain release factor N(5)-glutamine methyltransferase [Spirochaetes bacterium]|nr:peptide chain release factor N(5)-glutamine methyltransferase [Spirochaetota bacterium]
MILLEAVNTYAARLRSAGIESSRLDSEVIVSHVLGFERYRLITESSRILSGDEMAEIEKYIERREKREPLAYLLNEKEFYSLPFYVDQNVLIPRPETELLVDMVIYEAALDSRVLDLCTGSGAIAVACKKFRSDLDISASDISRSALNIAEKNCKQILKNDSVAFILSDIFENISGKFDIIVTNPPYVSELVRNDLEPELNYEPDHALFSGESGNEIISSIISQSPEFLNPGGLLLMELGRDNREFVKSESMKYFDCSIFKDYSGLDRIAMLKLKDTDKI